LSLSVFSLIYESMTQFLGASWIVWAVLFILVLVVFSTILKVPYMITFAVSALPFLLLAMYSAIQISPWIMFLVLMVLGLILAISMYKIIAR